MRRVRPEAIASVRQVRTAAFWAFAFSAGAAMSALVIPLAVIHADATRNGQLSQHAFGWLALVLVATLLVRGLFLSARSRLLTHASLWLAHTLGAQVLTYGLDAVRSPNDLDRDRTNLDDVARAIPTLATLFDAILLILPLVLLALLSPVLAMITFAAFSAMLAVAIHLMAQVRRQIMLADKAQADTDGAWRTAAASSVVIAARGMTSRAVADWQTLNARAIARAYEQSRHVERAALLLTLIRHVSLVALLAAATMSTGGAELGVYAAVLLLHEGTLRTLTVAIEHVPTLCAAQRHLNALMAATPHALGAAVTTAAEQAPATRPVPARQAVAS